MPISDKKVEHALDVLVDREHTAAKARAAHEYISDMDKVVLAKLMGQSEEKSNAAKETWARAHPDYEDHLEQKKALAEMDYIQRDRRAAASAIIDLYRTEQSNARVAGRLQ